MAPRPRRRPRRMRKRNKRPCFTLRQETTVAGRSAASAAPLFSFWHANKPGHGPGRADVQAVARLFCRRWEPRSVQTGAGRDWRRFFIQRRDRASAGFLSRLMKTPRGQAPGWDFAAAPARRKEEKDNCGGKRAETRRGAAARSAPRALPFACWGATVEQSRGEWGTSALYREDGTFFLFDFPACFSPVHGERTPRRIQRVRRTCEIHRSGSRYLGEFAPRAQKSGERTNCPLSAFLSAVLFLWPARARSAPPA